MDTIGNEAYVKDLGFEASRRTNIQEGASSNYSTVELYTKKKMVEELQKRKLLKRLVEMETMAEKTKN